MSIYRDVPALLVVVVVLGGLAGVFAGLPVLVAVTLWHRRRRRRPAPSKVPSEHPVRFVLRPWPRDRLPVPALGGL